MISRRAQGELFGRTNKRFRGERRHVRGFDCIAAGPEPALAPVWRADPMQSKSRRRSGPPRGDNDRPGAARAALADRGQSTGLNASELLRCRRACSWPEDYGSARPLPKSSCSRPIHRAIARPRDSIAQSSAPSSICLAAAVSPCASSSTDEPSTARSMSAKRLSAISRNGKDTLSSSARYICICSKSTFGKRMHIIENRAIACTWAILSAARTTIGKSPELKMSPYAPGFCSGPEGWSFASLINSRQIGRGRVTALLRPPQTFEYSANAGSSASKASRERSVTGC